MAPATTGAIVVMDQSNLFWGINDAEAILITGIVAIIVAIATIISQRSIAARHATIQYIERSEGDRDLGHARRIFNEIARQPAGTGPWAHKQLSKEFRSITTVLNHYEMIAIAIQRGTFDDTTYRRWYRSSVLKAWNHAYPFVFTRRSASDNPALWHEFEEMARWYRGGPHMPHRVFWRRFF